MSCWCHNYILLFHHYLQHLLHLTLKYIFLFLRYLHRVLIPRLDKYYPTYQTRRSQVLLIDCCVVILMVVILVFAETSCQSQNYPYYQKGSCWSHSLYLDLKQYNLDDA
ncbi:hypothetical protein F4703DRAFT_1847445 [Phycomyces blakesleeanus]